MQSAVKAPKKKTRVRAKLSDAETDAVILQACFRIQPFGDIADLTQAIGRRSPQVRRRIQSMLIEGRLVNDARGYHLSDWDDEIRSNDDWTF